MALEAELNLFTSDPTLLERSPDEEYERAAEALTKIADAGRLRLLHALCLDADTPQKAAAWAGVTQSYAERELAAMIEDGLVQKRERPGGTTYLPYDGHLVVQLHVALAHGREGSDEEHPRFIARRRVVRTPSRSRSRR